MKIKAIASICRKVKGICLYHEEDKDRSWVGDGYAAYILPDSLSDSTLGSLEAIFDIPPEKAETYSMSEKEFPAGIGTADDAEETELNYDSDFRLIHEGVDMLPLRAPDGSTYLIKTRYLSPINDAEVLRLSLRHTDAGRPYIAAKDGLFLTGVIMPIGIRGDMRNWIRRLGAGIDQAEAKEIMGGEDDDS